MNRQPFELVWSNDVLELVLSTTALGYNIFTREAAEQLLEVLPDAANRNVAALVFRSGKRRSFINGADLLMAGTAERPTDIVPMTEVARRAYRAVRSFPAPSIAAISGKCYGCGVEFVMHCDWRLAELSFDTQFHMTELAECLFVPAFGATQDLPLLVGLKRATDFLLWGERWSATEAARAGLVDRTTSPENFEQSLAEFVARAVTHGKRSSIVPLPSVDIESYCDAVRARIEQLPPAYQSVHREAFELLYQSARFGPKERAYRLELQASGASVVRPVAKAAISYFFVNQLALHESLRDYEPRTKIHVCYGGDDFRQNIFLADLRTREVQGLSVERTAIGEEARLLVLHIQASSPGQDGARSRKVDAKLLFDFPSGELEHRTEMTLYAPLYGYGCRVMELACSDPCSETAFDVYACFERSGFVPILTRQSGSFASDRLLSATLGPLIRFVMNGGSACDVLFTLRDFNFVRLHSVIQAVAARASSSLVLPAKGRSPDIGAELGALHTLADATFDGGQFKRQVLDALLVSLLGFAIDALDSGSMAHTSIIDVLARNLIDFPLATTSLCRHLTPNRVSRILSRQNDYHVYLQQHTLALCHDFVARQRGFYSDGSPGRMPFCAADARA